MIAVVPFHTGDSDQAIRMLDWIADLGRCATDCLLVADIKVEQDEAYRVFKAAKGAFGSVQLIQTPSSLPDEKWPMGANWMFETALRHVGTAIRKPFLWLEPDCVPLKADWLTAIQLEYDQCRLPFMGAVLESEPGKPNLPPKYLAGCAVYPANADRYILNLLGDRKQAWDMITAPHVVPLAHGSELFEHFWGQFGLPPTFRLQPAADNPKNARLLSSIPQKAVLFHRCKDDSLINLLRTALIRETRWEAVRRRKAPAQRVIHCLERHGQRTADGERRVRAAFDSWVKLYRTSQVSPAHVWQYYRSSRDIGDDRGLPYLKDVLMAGVNRARSEDIIMLTNDDTVLHPMVGEIVVRYLQSVPAASSFRLNFEPGQLPELNGEPERIRKAGKEDLGRDLFAFRKEWLLDHWWDIPDMFLGEQEWDLVLAVMVREAAGLTISHKRSLVCREMSCELPKGYVLHEVHSRSWIRPELFYAPAKAWNHDTANKWFEDHGYKDFVQDKGVHHPEGA